MSLVADAKKRIVMSCWRLEPSLWTVKDMGCVLRWTNCLPGPFILGQVLCCDPRSIWNRELGWQGSPVVDRTQVWGPSVRAHHVTKSVIEVGTVLSGLEREVTFVGTENVFEVKPVIWDWLTVPRPSCSSLYIMYSKINNHASSSCVLKLFWYCK